MVVVHAGGLLCQHSLDDEPQTSLPEGSPMQSFVQRARCGIAKVLAESWPRIMHHELLRSVSASFVSWRMTN
jgi:hypothetical protein